MAVQVGALVSGEAENQLRLRHLRAREQFEEDFFRLFVETSAGRSNPVAIAKGEINAPARVEEIRAAKPDLIVAYGCSIIQESLLSAFRGRILNIHLGLSPYYRGSGTNYWPLVNAEPEFAGVTFMHMDAGIDTGEIIHQIRARIAPGDTPAQIGNRLILDMARVCLEVICRWDRLERMPQPPNPERPRFYPKKDYSENSVATLYQNFASGMIDLYLSEEESRCARAPLLRNPA
jgi:phosphoribosylglycinamide formyltransferase-1